MLLIVLQYDALYFKEDRKPIPHVGMMMRISQGDY